MKPSKQSSGSWCAWTKVEFFELILSWRHRLSSRMSIIFAKKDRALDSSVAFTFQPFEKSLLSHLLIPLFTFFQSSATRNSLSPSCFFFRLEQEWNHGFSSSWIIFEFLSVGLVLFECPDGHLTSRDGCEDGCSWRESQDSNSYPADDLRGSRREEQREEKLRSSQTDICKRELNLCSSLLTSKK